MPYVPDASSVTRMRALQSSSVADPVKKSASYVPAQPALLYSLRSSMQGRGLFPSESVLATSVVTPYVNPRHRGYITSGPEPVSDIITLDFAEAEVVYGEGEGADIAGYYVLYTPPVPSRTLTFRYINIPSATAYFEVESETLDFETDETKLYENGVLLDGANAPGFGGPFFSISNVYAIYGGSQFLVDGVVFKLETNTEITTPLYVGMWISYT